MAKLLIVDDELDVREFAANFFRKRKIQVSTAASGQEALDKIDEEHPQLVLLDIMMPGIDGIQVLERIRQKNKDLKVIMVTGKKPEEDASFDRCRTLGALGYIHKPLELEELESVVLKELK